jgi:hypothetical protein
MGITVGSGGEVPERKGIATIIIIIIIIINQEHAC